MSLTYHGNSDDGMYDFAADPFDSEEDAQPAAGLVYTLLSKIALPLPLSYRLESRKMMRPISSKASLRMHLLNLTSKILLLTGLSSQQLYRQQTQRVQATPSVT